MRGGISCHRMGSNSIQFPPSIFFCISHSLTHQSGMVSLSSRRVGSRRVPMGMQCLTVNSTMLDSLLSNIHRHPCTLSCGQINRWTLHANSRQPHSQRPGRNVYSNGCLHIHAEQRWRWWFHFLCFPLSTSTSTCAMKNCSP